MDLSVRLPKTIDARERTSGRADERDGWKTRERRGDDDGDCEIGGARRARRVGFVDAKEEAEGCGLTLFLDCNRERRGTDGCLRGRRRRRGRWGKYALDAVGS